MENITDSQSSGMREEKKVCEWLWAPRREAEKGEGDWGIGERGGGKREEGENISTKERGRHYLKLTICVIFILPDIESFVTYSERYEFYDHFGRPHNDRLSALLGEEAQVGGEGMPLPLSGMHVRTADST